MPDLHDVGWSQASSSAGPGAARLGPTELSPGEVQCEIGCCPIRLGRVQEGRATLLQGLQKIERKRSADDAKMIRVRGFLHETEARAAGGTASEPTP